MFSNIQHKAACKFWTGVLSLQIIIGINHLYTFSRSFMFSDDEEETKRVVRSQKDKRFVNNGVLTGNLLTTPHSVTEHLIIPLGVQSQAFNCINHNQFNGKPDSIA